MSTEASTSAAPATAPLPSSIPNQSAAPAPKPVPVAAPPVAAAPAPAATPGAPAATPPVAAEPPAPDLSRGFAQLASEEKRLRTERDQFKAERAQFTSFAEQLKTARNNPREALKLLGYSDEQVLASLAGEPEPTPAVDDRVARLEQTIAQRDAQAQTERQRQEAAQRDAQADQVIANFRTEVIGQLKAGASDKYALIATYGAESEVTARIEKHLLEKGELRPFAQVADELELELEGKARRALEIPKLKLVPSENRTGQSEQRSTTTTLTNRGTNGPAPPALPPLPYDPEARTAEILRRRQAS